MIGGRDWSTHTGKIWKTRKEEEKHVVVVDDVDVDVDVLEHFDEKEVVHFQRS